MAEHQAGMSRRQMLKMAGSVVAGAALAACGGTPAPTPTPQVIVKEVVREVTKEVPKEVTKVVEVQKEVTKVATVIVQGKRTPVKVLHFYADGPRRSMFDEFAGAFNRESQTFTVEPTYLPFNNMIEKTMAGIAANDAPEVIYTNSMSHPAGTWAVDGTIRQLDAYYEKSKLPAWDAKNWVPYGIAEGQCTRNGKKLGIPWTPDTRFMFMDVAAFQEVGLDVKKPPQTWDDLKAVADKLDKGKKGDWKRITFCPLWGNQFDFQWTWSIPYDHLERMDKDNIPLVDQPEIRETWNFFLWWRDRYSKADLDVFRSGFTGTMDPYIGGVNPIQISGSWMPSRYVTIVPKFQHAWALHPKHPGQKAVFTSWGDGAATVLPNKSKNPDGGWAWVEFCLDKERLSRWSIETGTFGPRLDAMMVPEVAAKTGAHWPLAVDQLSKTRARGQYHGVDVQWETFKGLQEVWDGKKTMDQALKDKQDELKTRILDWRKTHPGMF